MPPKSKSSQGNGSTAPHSSTSPSPTWTRLKSILSIPPPIKHLFDHVPLITYPPNDLPQRAPKPARIPNLYVFSTQEDAAKGRPSFNPTCLKWQTLLKIANIDHHLVASNNHASPTGALPFLLPSVYGATTSQDSLLPIPANRFLKYAAEHGTKVEESSSLRYEAYQSLLDHRIRNAWLYTLYLEPSNFESIVLPLYIHPQSTVPLIRTTLAHQLRLAAKSELLKTSSIIDIDDLYSEADKAFEALSVLLGDDDWFFGNKRPALFDAGVFAYTQLLLDDRLGGGDGWKEDRLAAVVKSRENLVRHRERLLVGYF